MIKHEIDQFNMDQTAEIERVLKKRDAHLRLADRLRQDYRDRRAMARERRIQVVRWREETSTVPTECELMPATIDIHRGQSRRAPPRPTLSLIIVSCIAMCHRGL